MAYIAWIIFRYHYLINQYKPERFFGRYLTKTQPNLLKYPPKNSFSKEKHLKYQFCTNSFASKVAYIITRHNYPTKLYQPEQFFWRYLTKIRQICPKTRQKTNLFRKKHKNINFTPKFSRKKWHILWLDMPIWWINTNTNNFLADIWQKSAKFVKKLAKKLIF